MPVHLLTGCWQCVWTKGPRWRTWPTTGGSTGAMRRVCATAPRPHTRTAPPPCWLATSTGRTVSLPPTAWLSTPSAHPPTPPIHVNPLLTPSTSASLWRATAEEEGGYTDGHQVWGSHARRTQSPRLHWELVVVFVLQLPPPPPPPSLPPPLPPWRERNPKGSWNPRGVLTLPSSTLPKRNLHPSSAAPFPSLTDHTALLTHPVKSCPPAYQLPPHLASPPPRCPRRVSWRICMEGNQGTPPPQREGERGWAQGWRGEGVGVGVLGVCAPMSPSLASPA